MTKVNSSPVPLNLFIKHKPAKYRGIDHNVVLGRQIPGFFIPEVATRELFSVSYAMQSMKQLLRFQNDPRFPFFASIFANPEYYGQSLIYTFGAKTKQQEGRIPVLYVLETVNDIEEFEFGVLICHQSQQMYLFSFTNNVTFDGRTYPPQQLVHMTTQSVTVKVNQHAIIIFKANKHLMSF